MISIPKTELERRRFIQFLEKHATVVIAHPDVWEQSPELQQEIERIVPTASDCYLRRDSLYAMNEVALGGGLFKGTFHPDV